MSMRFSPTFYAQEEWKKALLLTLGTHVLLPAEERAKNVVLENSTRNPVTVRREYDAKFEASKAEGLRLSQRKAAAVEARGSGQLRWLKQGLPEAEDRERLARSTAAVTMMEAELQREDDAINLAEESENEWRAEHNDLTREWNAHTFFLGTVPVGADIEPLLLQFHASDVPAALKVRSAMDIYLKYSVDAIEDLMYAVKNWGGEETDVFRSLPFDDPEFVQTYGPAQILAFRRPNEKHWELAKRFATYIGLLEWGARVPPTPVKSSRKPPTVESPSIAEAEDASSFESPSKRARTMPRIEEAASCEDADRAFLVKRIAELELELKLRGREEQARPVLPKSRCCCYWAL